MARSSNRHANAVVPSEQGHWGCGLLGCLGGLAAGLSGGAILLATISLISAMATAPQGLPPAPPDQANIRLVVTEDFLNRFIEPPPGGTVRVDLMPNNQLQVTTNTTLPLIPLPVEVNGIFELDAAGQTLEARLLDTQVAGVDLPPEINDLLKPDISQVNQDLSQAIEEVSQQIGVPVIVTGLSTTESELSVELREFPGDVN